MTNFIINKNFREKTQDINTESERIIKTAANLIKKEIEIDPTTTTSIQQITKYKVHGFQIIFEHS